MSALRAQPGKKIDMEGITGTFTYFLRLFVSGLMPNSVNAIKNIKEICETNFKGNYQLEVIDIYQQPELASLEQIVVLPVLIIKKPLPERRIIGDLSDRQKVIDFINFHA